MVASATVRTSRNRPTARRELPHEGPERVEVDLGHHVVRHPIEERGARYRVAVPVAASGACAAVRQAGAGCVCIAIQEPFYGVGLGYADFTQTSDAEVLELLRRAAERTHAAASPGK
jgi:hypothetical protein